MKKIDKLERCFIAVCLAMITVLVAISTGTTGALAATDDGMGDVIIEEVVEEDDMVVKEAVEDDLVEETLSPINTSEDEISEELQVYYSEDDLFLLGRLITREGRNLSYLEKLAIGQNVLLRVDSELYPDTIERVITQPHQYACDELPKHPSEEDLMVAFEVLDSWNLSQNGYTPEEEWRLPEEYLYFFGDGKHNYYYAYENGRVIFYDEMPNVPLPDNIYDLYRRIVKGVKVSSKAEAEEEYWEKNTKAEASGAV